MGCRIERCPYACHYPCAIDSGGEYVDNVGFYCPGHVHIAKKRKEPLCTYSATMAHADLRCASPEALTLAKWPTDSPVQYTAVNIWDDIDTEDIEFIAAHSHHWEQYTPTYLNQNLTSKVRSLCGVPHQAPIHHNTLFANLVFAGVRARDRFWPLGLLHKPP